MIPKLIHYCWYGKKRIPNILQQCIESWKVYCPDYEIIKWDESNTPMDIPWIRDSYSSGKYAFVADYVRFWVLYKYGGIYLDTDMLLIKPMDMFRTNHLFFGKEDANLANMGIIGGEAGHPFFQECIQFYDTHSFDVNNLYIITEVLTPTLEKYGYLHNDSTQLLSNGVMVYQPSFFYPVHWKENIDAEVLLTPLHGGYVDKNKPTYAIHLWYMSWGDELIHLKKKHYREGFAKAWKKIRKDPFQPLWYYKKLGKYFLKMICSNRCCQR